MESCRLEETLGDGEKLSLTIKMARERDSERLAVRPEARRWHRIEQESTSNLEREEDRT